MNFQQSLKNVIVHERKHRFLVDVEDVNGVIKPAYLSNNTKMLGLFDDVNVKGMISSQPKGRRLEYNLEMIFAQGTLVGVNTNNTLNIVKEALKNKEIPELSAYVYKKSLKKYKDNVFELENNIGMKCMLVVCNIYWKKGATLVYPDGIYPHETAMLKEMSQLIAKNYKVVILFIAQRNDALDAKLGWEIDANYAEAFSGLVSQGAEVLCYYTWMTFKDIKLKDKMEFRI